MSLTAEEQIKIDNFKAQYNSIRSNITVANTELEGILAQREGALASYLSICKDIEVQLSQLDQLYLREKELEDAWAKREAKVLAGEEKLRLDKEAFEQRKEELKELESREKEILDSVADALEDLSRAAEAKVSVELSIDHLSRTADDKTADIARLEKERLTLEQSILGLKEEAENTKRALAKEIADDEKKLEAIRSEIAAEKQKIDLPMKALAEREQEVNRKEKNLEILVDRFKKHWKREHPDLVFKL